MPDKEHIHRYVRLLKKKTFGCADPDCKMKPVEKAVIEGKRSICNICMQPFILTNQQLMNRRPRCESCKRTNKNKDQMNFTELFK